MNSLLVALLASRAFEVIIIAQMPSGFELITITADAHLDHGPRINNCGQMVYSTWYLGIFELSEIVSYENGFSYDLTDNVVADWLPEINEGGSITWTEIDASELGSIWVFDGAEAYRLSAGQSSSINEQGELVWKYFKGSGCTQSDADIYYYDGNVIQQLTEDSLSNQGPIINNASTIVWTEYDFCQVPWDARIMMWKDGVTTQLSTDTFEPQVPTINDLGVVAWQSDYGIEVWDNGEVTLLTDWGHNPQLNNIGDMSFLRWHDESQSWHAWLLSGGVYYRLTEPPIQTVDTHINDFGEVVMMTGDYPTYDIMFMRRIRTGDYDMDGDVDADDAAAFATCYTGPGRVDGLCQCRFEDIDHDGDVDCDDWTLFKANWTADDGPPDFETCDGPTPCEGDVNGDGVVDPLDSGYVLARFNCPVGSGDPLCDAADANLDGLVDPLDAGFVLARFGGCE